MRPDLYRAASLAPTTFNAKDNTVEVVLSTGAAVQRAGYVEKLDVDGADLRSIAGAPVLDAHNQFSARAVIGVIQKAWRADGQIRALLKLSSRDDIAGIVRDIKDGILRAISVGYSVLKWRDESNSKGERTRTALAWKILEASFVPIGADPGAQTRSRSMRKTKKGAATATPETEADVIDNAPANVETETEPTVAETRAEIRSIMRRAGGTPEQADELIDQDATVEQARAAAYDLMTRRTQNAPRVRTVASHEDPQAVMQRRQGGLYSRITGATPKPEEREHANTRLVDHARASLIQAGIPVVGLSDFDIIQRAHTTSDFPELLTGTGNRMLLEQFEAARSPLTRLGNIATAPDFRPKERLRTSELSPITELGGENSELKDLSRTEASLPYSINTAGGIFALSFRAMVNDDLSAFADFSRVAAQAVAQYQKGKIINLIEGNGVMEDGVALFHADHNNLGTPGGIIQGASLFGLSEARQLLRTQKGLDGLTTLNLRPRFLVVPADMETEAQQAVALVAANTVEAVNPFAEALEVLVESDLARLNWYVFADPAACPVFEHAWLSGFQGPQLASQDNFRNLSREFRVVAHWGCGLLVGGWRGAVLNRFDDESNSAGG